MFLQPKEILHFFWSLFKKKKKKITPWVMDYWSLVSQGTPCLQVVFSLPSPLLPLPRALGLWMLWLDGCCQRVWSFLCLSFKAVHEHDPSLPPLYRLSYLFVYLFIFFPQNTLILSVWIKVAAYGCFPAALCCPAGLGAWCWAFTGLTQPISPAENSLFFFFFNFSSCTNFLPIY